MTTPDGESILAAQSLVRLLADLVVMDYKIRHLIWRLPSDVDQSLIGHLLGCSQSMIENANRLGQLVTKLEMVIPHDYMLLTEVSSVSCGEPYATTTDCLEAVCIDHVQISQDANLVLTVVYPFLDPASVNTVNLVLRNNERCARALGQFLPDSSQTTH